MEDKLKEIGKLFKTRSLSVTQGQGTEHFADADLDDFEVVEVSEECNK